MSYKCAECGQEHDDLPDLGCQWPGPYFSVPEEERDTRVVGDSDLCAIDGEDFFIRGVLLIPIVDGDEAFGIGAWVSQKRENYATYRENPESADIGPFFGWFSNHLPFYKESTLGLRSRAVFQGGRSRPIIELAPCEHLVYRHYSEGITTHQAWELVAPYL